MQIAERMKSIPFTPIRKIFEEANRREAAGETIIHLEMGRPDFDTPAHIKAAAIRAIEAGKVHYSSNYGLPELRAAIADKFKRDNNLDYDPATEKDSKEPVDDFQAEFEKLVQLDQEWRDHFSQTNVPQRSSAEDEEKRQYMFDSIVAETSLQEFLLEQVRELDLQDGKGPVISLARALVVKGIVVSQTQPHPGPGQAFIVIQIVQVSQRPLIVVDGFPVNIERSRSISGRQQVSGRFFALTGLVEVAGLLDHNFVTLFSVERL